MLRDRMNRTFLAVTAAILCLQALTASAADNKPTPTTECAKPARGCSSNTIDAACSKMECRAKGCKGDFSSGDCKTLGDLHEASCELASDKCGKDLPTELGLATIADMHMLSLSEAPMEMAPTKPISKRDFRIRRERLLVAKKVDNWSPGQPGQFTVELTVSECTWLGGKVTYWGNCEGTQMKCTAANGREMCVDEVK